MGKQTGLVTWLGVKGSGQNSAMIQFSLTPDVGVSSTYIVTAYPAFEPQVFSGMAALLAAAYYAQRQVEIEYYEVPRETPRCTSVELTQKKGRPRKRGK
jgi:hypothetical protein